MARYTGAVCKICRREGIKLFLKGERCLTDKCAIERRPYPPGEHGRRRQKMSEYSRQLREKQKVRKTYGILEKQFRHYYEQAVRQKGITGENLLRLLELRLDNVVYRSGFAFSRAEARQLVRHKHFLVNERKVNIPSYRVKVGDVIKAVSKDGVLPRIQEAAQSSSKAEVPAWLEVDSKNITAKIKSLPSREEIDLPVQEQLIVELYSK